MRTRTIAATFIMVVSALMLVPALSDDASAADGTEYETWYCYSHTVVLAYPYDSDGLTVDWDIFDMDGNLLREENDASTISYSTDLDGLLIRQDVRDSNGATSHKTIIVVIVPRDDDPLDVVFLDRDSVYHTHTITSAMAIKFGNAFVSLPAQNPTRDGYDFSGWYTDPDCTQLLDVYAPVLDDMIVYAGWTRVGGGESGGGGHVIVNNNTVTFRTDPGLHYTLGTTSTKTLTFTVSALDGYLFSDVSVTSDGGTLTESGGTYTLSGITRDIVVTISGDRQYSVSYVKPAGATVTADGYGDDPSVVDGGSLTMTVSGLESFTVNVRMGDRDVTSECWDGTTITIPEVTGNIVVYIADTSSAVVPDDPDRPSAQSSGDGFPWWIVVLILAVVIAALVILLAWMRRRHEDEREFGGGRP